MKGTKTPKKNKPMQTTYSDPEPLNWCTLPIWAIPQLAHIRDRLRATITSFTYDDEYETTQSAIISLYIPDEGSYFARIHKEDMNLPHIPQLWHIN